MRIALAVCLCVLLLGTLPACAQVVVDRGFETPSVTSDYFRTYSAGAVVDGWTIAYGDINLVDTGYTLQATSTLTSIEFASLTTGSGGPQLDGITLTAVPEPSGILALFCGISGLLAHIWRRRASAE